MRRLDAEEDCPATYHWLGSNDVGEGRMFMDMDKMVGPDFEKGLANLDTVTASAPKPAATTPVS